MKKNAIQKLHADMLREARSSKTPGRIDIAILFLFGQRGKRIVTSTIEHGDGEGLAYVDTLKKEIEADGLLKKGEVLITIVTRIELFLHRQLRKVLP
jgi:hypothetical protein